MRDELSEATAYRIAIDPILDREDFDFEELEAAEQELRTRFGPRRDEHALSQKEIDEISVKFAFNGDDVYALSKRIALMLDSVETPFTVKLPRSGLLNNELYVGRLVWNRLRYVKDPETGRRVSRLNPPEAWTLTAVPELCIVETALWNRVKHRQSEIDADPRVTAIKATRFWEKKRTVHLLTGLLRCGCCGGGFAAVGRDYVACSAASKLGSCDQRRSFRRAVLEDAFLGLLRDRLMQPAAVAQFISAYTAEVNDRRGAQSADRGRLQSERAQVVRKLEGLYDAISDGLRTPG